MKGKLYMGNILIGLFLIFLGTAGFTFLLGSRCKKACRIFIYIILWSMCISGGVLIYKVYQDCKAEVKKQEAHCEYVKNKIAAEYPDALDYSTAKPFIIWLCDSDDYDGTFESDGVKYKFKEAEDLHGNKVLSIISTGKKNSDTKVIKMDDNLETD